MAKRHNREALSHTPVAVLTPPAPKVVETPPTPEVVETPPTTVTMTKEQFDQLVGKVSQVDALMALIQGVAKKNGRGGRHPAQAVLDTKTGKVYRTKASAGIAVAPEFGLKVHNFVWYELTKGTKEKPAKCPDRFKEITQEEYEARKNGS